LEEIELWGFPIQIHYRQRWALLVKTLDSQDIHGELHNGKAIEVRMRHHIGHIAMDE